MRVLLLILLLLAFYPMAHADDMDPLDSMSDSWDAYSKTIDKSFDGQKPVTDDTFNKTIENIKAKRSQKHFLFWTKKKQDIKPLSPIPFKPDTYDNSEMQSLYNKIENNPTIMIPTTVITDNDIILQPGYYKLSNKKENDGTYSLLLSQGTTVIATIPAKRSTQDYEQKEINYYNVIPVSDKYLKIIYGNLDLGIETLLEIKN